MKKILLAEDDSFIVDIYSTKLKKAGYNVEVAKNGGEVLDKLKKAKPDLLLLDIVLPVFTGWEILEKIRKTKEFEKFKDLPIIIVSNVYQKEDVEKAEKLGVKRYIVKANHTPSQVIKQIKDFLKQHPKN